MNGWVFDSFKYYLGKQKIDWNGDFRLFLVPALNQSECRGLDNSNITKIVNNTFPAGYIYGLTNATVNSLTNQQSTSYYEDLEAYPASAYIFSNEYNGPLVSNDYDYYAIANTHEEVYDAVKNKTVPFNLKYWADKYQFSPSFDESEFDYYGLTKTNLDENKVQVKIDTDKLYDVKKHSYFAKEYWNQDKTELEMHRSQQDYPQGQGLLIYYKGSDKDATFRCPVCYLESAQYIKANGELSIDWNTNGLMELQ